MTETLMERLRRETAPWHAALEATAFGRAMLSETLPLDRYVGQLAANRVVLAALEEELARSSAPTVAMVWQADLAKVDVLDRDLAFFATASPPAAADAGTAADAWVADIRQAATTAPEDLIGFLYVMEGSTFGAMILSRHVRAAYKLENADGLAYYLSGDRARWAAFTARMNEAVSTPQAQDRVVEAAQRAYRHTAAITEALSPTMA